MVIKTLPVQRLLQSSNQNRIREVQGSPENLNSHDNKRWVITTDSRRAGSHFFLCLSVGLEPYYSAGPQCDTYKVSVQKRWQHRESLRIKPHVWSKDFRKWLSSSSLHERQKLTSLDSVLTLCQPCASFTTFTSSSHNVSFLDTN